MKNVDDYAEFANLPNWCEICKLRHDQFTFDSFGLYRQYELLAPFIIQQKQSIKPLSPLYSIRGLLVILMSSPSFSVSNPCSTLYLTGDSNQLPATKLTADCWVIRLFLILPTAKIPLIYFFSNRPLARLGYLLLSYETYIDKKLSCCCDSCYCDSRSYCMQMYNRLKNSLLRDFCF